MKNLVQIMAVWLLALASPYVAQAESALDTALPEYTKQSGISGNIISVGSDTLANLMKLWAEVLKR